MAKEQKPKYESPYKEIVVSQVLDGETVEFPVEVLNDSEVEHQKEIRWECVKRTHGLYKEKTLMSYAKRHEKLFDANTEQEVMNQIVSNTGPSMTELFRYRDSADILEQKKSLIVRNDYMKLVDFAIKSLREHGCIHPEVKAVLQRIQ